MRLILKQRIVSWFDSYDVFDEGNRKVYSIKGKISWGHCFHIYDKDGNDIARVKESRLSVNPRFSFYVNGEKAGTFKKQLGIWNDYRLPEKNWRIQGNYIGWNYQILDKSRNLVAILSKEYQRAQDTYAINIRDDENALCVLMIAVALDAQRCTDAKKNGSMNEH